MTIATNVLSDVPEVNKDDAPTPREWELKNTKKARDAHRRVESHLLHNVKLQGPVVRKVDKVIHRIPTFSNVLKLSIYRNGQI